MSKHAIHEDHDHEHGPGCGHKTIEHEGHTCYLHDGHLHYVEGGHVHEHRLSVGGKNPADCTPAHDCQEHDEDHTHGPSCGHEPVAHGDHTCYVVGGHLHYAHGNHCDDHGPVTVA